MPAANTAILKTEPQKWHNCGIFRYTKPEDLALVTAQLRSI